MNNLGKFGMALALASFVAATQAAPVAYEVKPVNDNWGSGGVVVKNGTDELCWRDSNWTPATANAQCDGALAPAAAPVKQKMSGTFVLDANAAFAFNSSVITPKGKAHLDNAVVKMSAYSLESLAVKGYTDSIGSAAYNQKLSEKRASAVHAYLVSKGIPASKMTTTGYGATNFVVDPASCKGNQTAKIACEAANRRVNVDFVGDNK
jgi:OOP family OmpA-OmpF porin